MPARRKRIAAIDIGTNSIHMIVAELRGRSYRVVDREKEMVQLGLSSLDGEPLAPNAIERGVATLTRMAELAARWNCDEIIAVATSAVREAPNRREFLRRVKDASGLRVRVITGDEEADYIFRAVRASVDINGSTACCIDIGGGSVEIVVGTEDEVFFTASEPLGSLRLSQRFALADLPDPRDVERCRNFAATRTRKLAKKIRRLGVDLAIGTSGTILAIANVCCASATDAPTAALRRVDRESLERLIASLVSMTARERVEQFGFDEKRATTIVGGAIALQAVMTELGLDSLLACQAAIREGIIESRVAQALNPRGRAGRSPRRESVLGLAQRTQCDIKHGEHVARLATRIFDQTRAMHELPASAREMLEYAAMLHETGLHISERGHHKHNYYLIRHADLRGFTEEQLLLVANVARYYRKSPPEDGHENLAELTAAQRSEVEKLAAILRVAEGLDRGHRQRVRDVAVRVGAPAITFTARTRSDAKVELASAKKRARYFSDLFNVDVEFNAV